MLERYLFRNDFFVDLSLFIQLNLMDLMHFYDHFETDYIADASFLSLINNL